MKQIRMFRGISPNILEEKTVIETGGFHQLNCKPQDMSAKIIHFTRRYDLPSGKHTKNYGKSPFLMINPPAGDACSARPTRP